MVNQCFNAFEQRLDNIAEQISGQPRQEVKLSRIQIMIAKKLQELMNHNLQPYGINDTIWTALVMIYSSTGRWLYPSDLSHVLGSSRTHITRFADEMVAKGWLSRREHEEDRRKTVLTLTTAGIALVEAIMPKQWSVYQALWQDFSTAEKDLMENLQRKLLDTLGSFDSFSQPDKSAVAMCTSVQNKGVKR
jgi:MarR family transcriptional repressor of emrRAB